jgi:molecular chaperone GrpE
MSAKNEQGQAQAEKPEDQTATSAADESSEQSTDAAHTEQVKAELDLTPEQALQAELDVANAKVAEHWDQLLRSRAELENVRKRAARDAENARKFALEGIAAELLPVRDSLELGLDAANSDAADLQSVRDGMQLIQQMLAKLMEQYGIRAVEPVGEVFNPELHQAMSMQETADQAPNTVLAVMQKGYTLNERLLRPAMVVVAKAASAPATEDGDESSDKQD